MNKNLTHLLSFAAALAISAPAWAAPFAASKPNVLPVELVQTVEADCFGVGQDKAAELGGTLAKAKPDMDGDTPVCRLVIVVPGQDGERPKRVEIVVPQ